MSETIRIDVTGNAEKKLGDIAKESKKAADGVGGMGGSAVKAAAGLFTMEKILQGVRAYLNSGAESADEMKAAFDRVGKAIVEALNDPEVDAALSKLAGNVSESADVISQLPAFFRFASRDLGEQIAGWAADIGALNREIADTWIQEGQLLQQADGDRLRQRKEELKELRQRKAEEELAARDRSSQFQTYIEALRDIGGLESVISEKREEYLDLARAGNLTEEKKRELLAAIQATEGEIKKRKQEQIKAEEDARRKAEAEEKRRLQIQEQIEDALWQQSEAQAETAKELADQLDTLDDIDRRIRTTQERLKDQTLAEKDRLRLEKDITREVERRGKAMDREVERLREIAKQKEEEHQRDQKKDRDEKNEKLTADQLKLKESGLPDQLLNEAANDPNARKKAKADARSRRDQMLKEADDKAEEAMGKFGANRQQIERDRKNKRREINRDFREGNLERDSILGKGDKVASQAVIAAKNQVKLMAEQGKINDKQAADMAKVIEDQARLAADLERQTRNTEAIRNGVNANRQRRLQAGMGRG